MEYNAKLLTKNLNYKIKTPEQIKKQGTSGLLSYYKSLHSFQPVGTCDCCGESLADLYPSDKHAISQQMINEEFFKYKQFIKEELNTREHIPKKRKSDNSNPNRNVILLKRYIKNNNLHEWDKEKIKELYDSRAGMLWFYNRDKFPFGQSLTKVWNLCESIKFSLKSQETSSK